MKLYNSYCCNIYCCALVFAYHKTILDKFPVAATIFLNVMGVPRDFSASALFVNLNTLICTLFNSVHFEKCNLKKEWDNVLLIRVEHYDNEVLVYSVYNKLFSMDYV